MDGTFVNKLILPGKGKKYSGTRSRGLVWLKNSKGHSFPNHFLKRNTKTVILYSHGNGGTLGDFKAIVNFYSDWFSTSIFAIEYPGYGPAEGEANEASVNDNLQTAYEFLTRELGYPTSNIILIGYSIGTGPVIHLGSRLCEQGDPPGAVVTIAAFKSLCDIVADWKGTMFATILSGVLMNRWDSMAKMAVLDCPVMFIHGALDEVIPPKHSEYLHRACVSEHKVIRICPNADHAKFNEPFDTVDAISAFLEKYLRPDLSITIQSTPTTRMQCPPTVAAKEKLIELNKINDNMTLIGENACIGGDGGCVTQTFYNIFFFWLPDNEDSKGDSKKLHSDHTDHYKMEKKNENKDEEGADEVKDGAEGESEGERGEEEASERSHLRKDKTKKKKMMKKEFDYKEQHVVVNTHSPAASPEKALDAEGREMGHEEVLQIAVKILDKYFEAFSLRDIEATVANMDENVLVRYPEEPGKPSKSWAGLTKARSRYSKMFKRSPSFSASYRMLPGAEPETEGYYATLMVTAKFECEKSGLNVIRDIMYVVDSHSEKVIIVDHR